MSGNAIRLQLFFKVSATEIVNMECGRKNQTTQQRSLGPVCVKDNLVKWICPITATKNMGFLSFPLES